MDPERRYRKRYSEIEVRLGDKEIRFRIGIDRNGVRTGSDTSGALSGSVFGFWGRDCEHRREGQAWIVWEKWR